MIKAPILVTGFYRSATTWTGIIICYSKEYGSIHEPFNPDVSSLIPRLNIPFMFICKENEDQYLHYLDKIINFNYNLGDFIGSSKVPSLFTKNRREYLMFKYFKFRGYNPLIKDPIAIFSADWLADKYDMNVVVLSRHPLGFISSLLKNNMGFDFRYFIDQPLLIDKYLKKYIDRIKELNIQLIEEGKNRQNTIKYGVLIWEIINSVIIKYKEKNKKWLFYRIEDIQLNTNRFVNTLYNDLNLRMGFNTRKMISYRLNVKKSKNHLKSWKNYFSEKEISLVKNHCQEKAIFYSNEDWE